MTVLSTDLSAERKRDSELLDEEQRERAKIRKQNPRTPLTTDGDPPERPFPNHPDRSPPPDVGLDPTKVVPKLIWWT